MSALPQIVLQKSFFADERNLLGLLMRFVRGDVGTTSSYTKMTTDLRIGPTDLLQRQRRLKIDLREIFGFVRFSTFATRSLTKQTWLGCPQTNETNAYVQCRVSARGASPKMRDLRCSDGIQGQSPGNADQEGRKGFSMLPMRLL